MNIDAKSFFEQLEADGESAVRTKLAASGYNSLAAGLVQEWLRRIEEARSSAVAGRKEAREDESLSISRKALRNSDRATWIATSAIVLSIIMAIQKLIEWLSR